MATAAQANGLSFKRVKTVTRPQLKLENDKPVYVTIESEIFDADPISKGRPRTPADGAAPAEGDKAIMQPPRLVNVLDLVHNKRESQMIVNAIVESELTKKYPSDAYVGKSFEIQKHGMQGGKRYATFDIFEIKVDDGATTQEQAGKQAVKR